MSGANGDRPERVRRTTARTRSRNGAAIPTAVVGVVLVLLLLLLAVQDTTLFDRRAFAFSTILAAVVWMIGEVRAFSRLKMLYVEPDRS